MTRFFFNNTQKCFAYPIYFSKAQSTSKLIIFSTQNSKEPTCELPNLTWDLILEILEDRELSLKLSFAAHEWLSN